jgi:pimeloyl-ACP methyl ester carboxylesterase
MDHYADDLAALTAHLDLKVAIHVGHSTGGGEVAHYLGRHGESRVAKAALISAVPPLMVKTAANPQGLPKEVFDDLQAQLAANRSQFCRDVAAGPFYGYNRPGAKASEAVIQNWWRQGMMGGAKAHYDGIVASSQSDFTEDLKKITISVQLQRATIAQRHRIRLLVASAARRMPIGPARSDVPATRQGRHTAAQPVALCRTVCGCDRREAYRRPSITDSQYGHPIGPHGELLCDPPLTAIKSDSSRATRWLNKIC